MKINKEGGRMKAREGCRIRRTNSKWWKMMVNDEENNEDKQKRYTQIQNNGWKEEDMQYYPGRRVLHVFFQNRACKILSIFFMAMFY